VVAAVASAERQVVITSPPPPSGDTPSPGALLSVLVPFFTPSNFSSAEFCGALQALATRSTVCTVESVTAISGDAYALFPAYGDGVAQVQVSVQVYYSFAVKPSAAQLEAAAADRDALIATVESNSTALGTAFSGAYARTGCFLGALVEASRRRRSLLQASPVGDLYSPGHPLNDTAGYSSVDGTDFSAPVPQCYAKTLFGAGSKETVEPPVTDSTAGDLSVGQMVGIYTAQGPDIGKFCVPTLKVDYLPPLPSVTLGALVGGNASTVTGAVSASDQTPIIPDAGGDCYNGFGAYTKDIVTDEDMPEDARSYVSVGGSMSDRAPLVFTGGAQCDNEDDEWVAGQFLVIGDGWIKEFPDNYTLLSVDDFVELDFAVLQILSVTPENPNTGDTTDDAVPVAYKWFNTGSGYISTINATMLFVPFDGLTFLRLAVSGTEIASCGSSNSTGLGNPDPVSGLRVTLTDTNSILLGISPGAYYSPSATYETYETIDQSSIIEDQNIIDLVKGDCDTFPVLSGTAGDRDGITGAMTEITVKEPGLCAQLPRFFEFPKPPARDLKGKLCTTFYGRQVLSEFLNALNQSDNKAWLPSFISASVSSSDCTQLGRDTNANTVCSEVPLASGGALVEGGVYGVPGSGSCSVINSFLSQCDGATGVCENTPAEKTSQVAAMKQIFEVPDLAPAQPPAEPPSPTPVVCQYVGTYQIKPKLKPCSNRYIASGTDSDCGYSRAALRKASQQGGKTDRIVWQLLYPPNTEEESAVGVPNVITATARPGCANKYLAAGDSYQQDGTLPMGGDSWKWQVVPANAAGCDVVNLLSQNRADKGKDAYLMVTPPCDRFAFNASDGGRQKFELVPVA